MLPSPLRWRGCSGTSPGEDADGTIRDARIILMANLQIKNLPDEVHDALRERAAREGVTVRAYVQRLIEADLALPAASEWLTELRRCRTIDLGQPVSELVEADRAARPGS